MKLKLLWRRAYIHTAVLGCVSCIIISFEYYICFRLCKQIYITLVIRYTPCNIGHIFFFFVAIVAARCRLVALHCGQSQPGIAFALPRDKSLWILDSHYCVLFPPLSAEIGGSGRIVVYALARVARIVCL